MTREEAKAWFKVLLKDEYAFNSADREAFAMAIKALEQEPCDVFDEYGNYNYPSDVELTEPNTATSMPCEDAISREDALMCLTGEWTEITDEIIHRFIKRIKALPPVNPQPKTGRWIHFATSDDCSECGWSTGKYESPSKYCPQCGAKMSKIPTGSDPQISEKVN